MFVDNSISNGILWEDERNYYIYYNLISIFNNYFPVIMSRINDCLIWERSYEDRNLIQLRSLSELKYKLKFKYKNTDPYVIGLIWKSVWAVIQ